MGRSDRNLTDSFVADATAYITVVFGAPRTRSIRYRRVKNVNFGSSALINNHWHAIY